MVKYLSVSFISNKLFSWLTCCLCSVSCWRLSEKWHMTDDMTRSKFKWEITGLMPTAATLWACDQLVTKQQTPCVWVCVCVCLPTSNAHSNVQRRPGPLEANCSLNETLCAGLTQRPAVRHHDTSFDSTIFFTCLQKYEIYLCHRLKGQQLCFMWGVEIQCQKA